MKNAEFLEPVKAVIDQARDKLNDIEFLDFLDDLMNHIHLHHTILELSLDELNEVIREAGGEDETPSN